MASPRSKFSSLKGTSPSGRTVKMKAENLQARGALPGLTAAAPPLGPVKDLWFALSSTDPAEAQTEPAAAGYQRVKIETRPDFRMPCVSCRQPWKPQPGTLARMRCGCDEWLRQADGKWIRVKYA